MNVLILALLGCPSSSTDTPTSVDDITDSTLISTGETGDSATLGTTPSGDTGTTDTSPPYEGPHNVLLVLVDDISPPKVGHYGESTEVRTPVMDALAADGVWFRNAWAAPSCSPTRAAFQTGRFGRRTGFGSVQEPTDVPFVMSAEEMFLPALLQQAPTPYATSMHGKWHLTPTGSPTDRGWGTWQGSLVNLQGLDGNPGSYFAWRKTLEDGTVEPSTTYVTTDTTDDAVLALQTLPEPWLVHVSYNAAHAPFEVPPASLHTQKGLSETSEVIDLQRAVLEAMDTELGRLLDAIEPDVRDRTTVLVVGDNGEKEEIREPGSGPGGKLSLLDGGVRVPVIAQGSAVPARGPSDALIHVVDVVPTILELAGLPPADAVGLDSQPVVFDGRSLTPMFTDPSETVRDVLYTELFEPNGVGLTGPMLKDFRVARTHDYKLVVDVENRLEYFYEYTPDHPEQQPDNLLEGTLDATEEAALEALRGDIAARYAAMRDDLPY